MADSKALLESYSKWDSSGSTSYPPPPPLLLLPPTSPPSSSHLPPISLPSLPPSLSDSCMIHGAAAWGEFHFVTRHWSIPVSLFAVLLNALMFAVIGILGRSKESTFQGLWEQVHGPFAGGAMIAILILLDTMVEITAFMHGTKAIL